MTKPRRSLFRILLYLSAPLAALIAIWLLMQRIPRAAMESYVPESALGYIEINNVPQLVDDFTQTNAWRQLAPVYGLPASLNWLGSAGRMARRTGIGSAETLALARAQLVLAITGIEAHGGEIRPRLALIAETHTSASRLAAVINDRLPQLAAQVYGQSKRETSDYGGVPVTIYRGPESRSLLSAQLGSVWIIANHPDAMRACIETRQGREPSLTSNDFHLKAARALLAQNGGAADHAMFAFVSNQGVTRLTRLLASLITSRLTQTSPFTGAIESLAAEAVAGLSNGAALAADFENGAGVTRTAVLLKPAIATRLQKSIKTGSFSPADSPITKLLPAAMANVTVVNVENPAQALDELERVFSTQLGAGQSFIIHGLFLYLRESLLGLKPGEKADAAFSAEIASLRLADGPSPGKPAADPGSIMLVAGRDQKRLRALAEQYLANGGAAARPFKNTDIIVSADPRRGAAAFLGSVAAFGAPDHLLWLIREQEQNKLLRQSEPFSHTDFSFSRSAPLLSFSTAAAETSEALETLARRLDIATTANPAARADILRALPLSVSAATLAEQGLRIESRAPLGILPLLIGLLETE
ncbi:MAG: hypothetical protein ACKV2V_24440 [Blastocatellia bacterium]